MLRVTRHQHSLKYAHHVGLNEMRQPDWIDTKYNGSARNYYGQQPDLLGKHRFLHRMTSHMNTWWTDMGPANNYHMMANATLNATPGAENGYDTLLGRKTHHENMGTLRVTSYSETDLSMDQRFKGAQRKAIANLVDEPLWNSVMYPLNTLRQRSNGDRNYSADSGIALMTLPELTHDGVPQAIRDLANNNKNSKNNSSTSTNNAAADPVATYQLMTIKTKQHVEAYWKNLKQLITLHRPAVGDINDEFQSRSIRHVHQAFVVFQDAIRSHNFQDSYLIRHLQETRPKELDDIFGIFLEMESNYVNHDYCPRCSLPTATTRYCGEGDKDTPFRTNRGRWAPHKTWGKEWYDVVVRRAEQLWYRSTEDPLFGAAEHTQKQVEEMLKVYCKTNSRGKAIHFMTSIRGSLEFLQNKIKITPEMQKMVDKLLDETPHPHLLTNGFRVQSNGVNQYLLSSTTGNVTAAQKASTVPLSPLQFRVDMEMNKLRREQKEQGAIRLPPQGWKINTEHIVPYKVGPNGKVTNWRQVKEGIEKSFLDTGLPQEAFTAEELREMAYLNDHLATREEKKAALKSAFESERDAARKEGKLSASSTKREKAIFPTADYYQIFDVSDSALAPFNTFLGGAGELKHGMMITAERSQFPDPKNVVIGLANTTYTLDTTDETCRLYGFLHGQVVNFTDAESKEQKTAIILGVDTQSSSQHQLIAVDRSSVPIPLGYDINDVRARCVGIAVDPTRPRRAPNAMRDLMKRTTEGFDNGTIIGVRNGELYVSWDHGVAVPLGSADVMQVVNWRFKAAGPAPSITSSTDANAAASVSYPAPREPYSWVTPFRNDWSEERLEELKRAPWNRERYVSLIKNKFTPIVKKFGYTQHITQDDFVTKEYKDRLTSKQFFTNPQAFAVVPDTNTKSVRFGGKEEVSSRLHGLPSADRNELENGWDVVPEVPHTEVAAIEQALRDISGKRPGNYIKTAAEAGSLKLNESWFKPLNWGWQQDQKEQGFLENGADRKNIDGSKLPFGGQLPAFGTTYGIGERIREVTEDFAKGFGLGGAQHLSPTADNNVDMNTLGFVSNNTTQLGYSNILVRLFNEKLGEQSIYSVAESLAQSHKVDPRNLLLSLNEWRTAGRNPSPVLNRVLADYLKTEITNYNAAVVNGADRIDLSGYGGASSAAAGDVGSATTRPGMINTAANSPWLHVDKDAFRTDFYLRQRDVQRGGADSDRAASGADGYIVSRVVEFGMRNVAATSDESLVAHIGAQLAAEFQLKLSASVDKNIPLAVAASAQAERKTDRQRGQALQLIRGDVLKAVLRSSGLGDTAVATIISGLSESADVVTLGANDFALPLQSILMWKGPRNSRGPGASASAAAKTSGSSSTADALVPPTGRSSITDSYANAVGLNANPAVTQHRFTVNPIYNLLMSVNEGAALDFAYAAAENMKNRNLRAEFVEACRGVVKVPAAGASDAAVSAELEDSFLNALYERYCEGLWVPTLAESTQMFVKFLKRCQHDPKLLVEYFNFKGETGGRNNSMTARNSAAGSEVSGLNKKRFINVPFTFDNVTIEALKAKQLSKQLNDLPPVFTLMATPAATNEAAAAPAAATTEGEATPASANASSSTGSSSAVKLGGLGKSAANKHASSSSSSAGGASSSSSSSKAVTTLNTQNYFDANTDAAFAPLLNEESVNFVFDAVKKAFPTNNFMASRSNNSNNSNAATAPPAPNSVYSGPFNGFLTAPNGMPTMRLFREWLDTVFPLLPSHYEAIDSHRRRQPFVEDGTARRLQRFSNILANEGNEQLEREFRQNAERYWRKIIDGKNLEEMSSVGGGGFDRQTAGGSSASGGGVNNRNTVSFGGGRGGGRGMGGGRGGGRGGNNNRSFSRDGNSNANIASASGNALRQGLQQNDGGRPSQQNRGGQQTRTPSSGLGGGNRGMMGGRGGGGRSSGLSGGGRGAGRGRN